MSIKLLHQAYFSNNFVYMEAFERGITLPIGTYNANYRFKKKIWLFTSSS